ncbi:MAG: hypothetical protein HC901_02620, partial [Bdellovibrionaceae bacterium]|nr:hypothetical protein [Pseudobdellovibrionaceae bacterium]
FLSGNLSLSPLRPSAWMILALGLTQIDLWAALFVVGWLFLLAWRGGGARPVLAPWLFNTLQILIIPVTLVATGILVAVAYNGLLGDPEMRIIGNGSSASRLVWYSPQADGALPAPSLWSVSHWFYRLAMLLWAFWLAFSFIAWLRWGWSQYLKDGFWKSTPHPSKPTPPPLKN